MLGFAPIAAAPFGATGEAGAFFDVSFEDAAEASSNLVAIADFSAEIPLESAAGQDSVLVAASVFGTLVDESAAAAITNASQVSFGSNIADVVLGTDAAAAQATFQANYAEAAISSIKTSYTSRAAAES